ncbi:MAG: hypothetical protein ACE5HD_02100 [Acidobacteriota bacterium]
MINAIAGPQQEEVIVPDTLLLLKNGAEVRGVFVNYKDGHFTMRLIDWRVMTYPAGDVEKLERLPISEPQPSPSSQATEKLPPFDAASCQVFVTEKDINKAFYTTVKNIKVSKKWHGSTAEMFGDLAKRARKVGADAVTNVRTWHSPSGFAWAAPHAGGMAVKLTEAGRKALPGLEGRCY